VNGAILGGVITGIIFILINIIVVAYSYGRMTQAIKDLSGRVERLENVINSKQGGVK